MRKQHYIILTVILTLVLCFFPGHSVSANGTCPTTAATGEGGDMFLLIVNNILKIGSWAWTLMAFLAGKLMSNEWVYASGLHLDQTLYKLWNYMKNIANFVIGFFFVVMITKVLFAKDGVADIKKTIPKFLIAGVLVNISWFAMGVMIDVANVATTAVGSFPIAFYNNTKSYKDETLKLLNSVPTKIVVDMDCPTTITSTSDGITTNPDDIRARFNDMSGPFLYMGLSIFRLHDFNTTNTDTAPTIKDLLAGTLIKFLILAMFLVPITALFFVNLKRIFYLWMIIVLSPLVVILDERILGGAMKFKAPKGLENIFSIKEVIALVFTPVFTVGGMAIAMILSTSMYYVLGGSPGNTSANTSSHVLGAVEIINTQDGSGTGAVPVSIFNNMQAGTEIQFMGDLFATTAKYAGGFIGYIIITGFTTMMIWAILSMSVSGSKIVGGTYNGIMNLAKNAATGFSFIPIGGGNALSLRSLATLPENTINKISGSLAGVQNKEGQELEKKLWEGGIGKPIARLYGVDPSKGTMDIAPNKIKDITNAVITNGTGTPDEFISDVKGVLKKQGKINITSESAHFKKAIIEGLKNASNKTLLKGIEKKVQEIDGKFAFPENSADKNWDNLFTASNGAFTKYLISAFSGKKAPSSISPTLVIFENDNEDKKT